MALNVTGVTFKDVASTLFQCVNRYIILYYIISCFQMKKLIHDNLNVFIGASIEMDNISLVWHYCTRGSLQVSLQFIV